MPDTTPEARSIVPRRDFLRVAGTAAVALTVAGCRLDRDATDATGTPEVELSPRRDPGLDERLLLAVAIAVLPGEIGPEGQGRAVADFLDWIAAYEPGAEAVHGYGFPDIQRLPEDPAPRWREQLAALDAAARAAHGAGFVEATDDQRRAVVSAALTEVRALGAPLDAPHVAAALLAHWAAGTEAWDLAFEARIGAGRCRPLDDAPRKPLPLAPRRLG